VGWPGDFHPRLPQSEVGWLESQSGTGHHEQRPIVPVTTGTCCSMTLPIVCCHTIVRGSVGVGSPLRTGRAVPTIVHQQVQQHHRAYASRRNIGSGPGPSDTSRIRPGRHLTDDEATGLSRGQARHPFGE